ncbi:MAG TPA: porin family protein [Segetibacter sp.]
MKKISLLLLTTLISLVSYCQHTMGTTTGTTTTHTRMTSFGLDVGANFARFNVDREKFPTGRTAPDADYKTGMHVAAFLDIPIGGMFSLKPQLMYSRQGAEIKQTATGGTTSEYDEKLNYLYVAPAAVQIMTPGGFIVESGPQLGFLLNAEQDRTTGTTDIKDARNKVDFLWNVGMGFMSKAGIGAHVRYNHGFSNVLSTSNDATRNANGKMSNRLFQLGLMYHFGKH